MKKAIIAIAVMAAAGISAGLVYLTEKTAARQTSMAKMVPGETLFLAEFPDLRTTASRSRETALWQILHEPELQAFLERPLSNLTDSKSWKAVQETLLRIQPRQAFLAVTSIANNQPRAVAGVRFHGNRESVETARILLAEAKKQAQTASPHGKTERFQYRGFEIEAFSDKGITVAATIAGNWLLAANELALLKTTLDRLAEQSAGSLSETEAYRQSIAHLPPDLDFRLFVRPASFYEKIAAVTPVAWQPTASPSTTAIQKIQAAALGTRLEGERIHDVIFILQPNSTPLPVLSRSTLGLTTPETIFYYAFAPSIPDRIALLEQNEGLPPILGGLRTMTASMGGAAASLAKLKQAFGPEVALVSQWEPGTIQPTLGLAVQVRNPGLAKEFAEAMFADWRREQGEKVTFWAQKSEKPLQTPLVVALTDSHLFAGGDMEAVKTSVARAKAGGLTLESAPPFLNALATVSKAETTLIYIDTKTLFERAYAWLRPMAMMSAALLPRSSQYIDIAKLPAAETISKHLQPMVLSGAQGKEGLTFESSGPVTCYQAGAALLVAAGVAAAPAVQGKAPMQGFGNPKMNFSPPLPQPESQPGEAPLSTE